MMPASRDIEPQTLPTRPFPAPAYTPTTPHPPSLILAANRQPHSEQKANLLKYCCMARPETETVLSREDLAEFTRRLTMLSVPGIESTYQTAYADCRFDGKKLSPAAAVQQLVAAWKVLRKMPR